MDSASLYVLNIHAVPMVIMGMVAFALGVRVLHADSQSIAHRHFFVFSTSCALWLATTGIGLCATTSTTALRWFQFGSASASCIPVAFYACSSEFLQLNRSRTVWLGYFLAMSLALTTLIRHDFIISVSHYWWGYFPQYGPLGLLLVVLCITFFIATYLAYLHSYSAITTPIRRQQIKFILSTLTLEILVPIDFFSAFGYELYPFGYVPVFILVIVAAVALLRYQLLDMALLVSMSMAYLPLIPFAMALFFVANLLSTHTPSILASILVLMTVAFTILYVTVQPRLQLAMNKLFFPSRYVAYNTLARFSQSMAMNLDLANLQAEIVGTLHIILRIERISLFLFEKEHGHYGLKVSHGIDETKANAMQLTNHVPFNEFLLNYNQPIVKEALERGYSDLDQTTVTTMVATLTQLDSEVCLPLVSKARLIGFINLGHKPSFAFYTQDELDLLHSLATGAAVALDNAMLYEDWKRSQLVIRRADRLRSLETIAGGFAHEIRNPLTTIKTFVQLAPSRRNDPEFMDSFGAVVADDLARIERLVEDILDYARYMKPKLSLESINEIVSSSLQFMEIKASSLNVSIEKQLTEQLPRIMVDRQQLKQVLMNLILNAIDAMKTGGGRLTVSTRPLTRPDGTRWIQIHVSDTGCGIAPEDLPHIFDPFFTTKHESTEHAGTGLGLSIVHEIIHEHSGTIEAHSTVGYGTTFILTLPEHREHGSSNTSTGQAWPGKLLPFPNLPPVLQRPTGTYGT